MWQAEQPVVLEVHAAARIADAVAAVEESARTAGVAGRDVVLLVSEHWLRWVRLPWQAEFSDQQALQLAARRALAESWQIDDAEYAQVVAVDDAPWGQSRAVVAIDRELLDALTAMLQKAGARRVAVRPLVSALAAARDPALDGAFFVADAAMVSVVVLRAGRLAAVFSQPVGDDAAERGEHLWRRVALREEIVAGLAAPVETRGFADAHASAAVDRVAPVFVELPPALTGRALLLAAACVLALVVAGGFAWYASGARSVQEQELAVRSAPPPRAEPLRADQQAQVRAVNRAIRQLNVPVTTLLRAVPPQKGLGVSLLGVEISGSWGAGGGAVSRIEAEARTPADMTGYVAQLNTHPALAAAWLSHHEVERDRSGRPYRFTVETRWKEGAQ